MHEIAIDRHLGELLHCSLGLSPEREEALWTDFTVRVAREAVAWAAFAAGLALAGRRLQTALPGSAWPGWLSHISNPHMRLRR